MRRTQLYLDEDMARTLSVMSRERGTTVSELVRECIREKFKHKGTLDKAALARKIAGIWKGRGDLESIDRQLRQVREDKRGERLKLG